jgi:phage shock protein E
MKPGVPRDIQRDELRTLVDGGAQLVEVLPASEYAKEHLPGAISLPLEDLRRDHAQHVLSQDRAVIVYCQDAV